MLTLPIKKKWFDMILSGEKKEEYREIKPYYDSRFRIFKSQSANNIFQSANLLTGEVNTYEHCQDVIFRNGYSSNSPSIKCKVKCSKGYGKEEWGAEPNKEYYVLKILSVEKNKFGGIM